MTESPKLKRPRNYGRCVHYREGATTKDHVFPDSWYPESTPKTVQRWTVPSRRRCNGDLGEAEKKVFVRLALCVNPLKLAATGLSKKAIRSMGIGAKDIDEVEKRKRGALRNEVLKDARPFSEEARPHVLPGLGPHPGAPTGQQIQINISANRLYQVAKKVVRGCEYWFAGGRIVEVPYEIEIFFADQANVPDIVRAFNNFSAHHFGPGFRVRRGAAREDPWSAIYEVAIWDTLTFYATILAPEGPVEKSG
jgi:hypothetical protein